MDGGVSPPLVRYNSVKGKKVVFLAAVSCFLVFSSRPMLLVLRMRSLRLSKMSVRVWRWLNSCAVRVCFGRSACAVVSFHLSPRVVDPVEIWPKSVKVAP